MPGLAGEPGVQKRRDDLGGQRAAHHAGAEAQHVHVVVLHRLVGGIGVVADGGANPRHLVGRNRHAGAAAAHHDAALGASLVQRLGDRAGRIRIVHRVLGMGAQILDGVAQTRQKGRQLLLQVQSRMIGRQRQLHAARLLYFPPMRNTNRCIFAGLFACLLAALITTAHGPLAAQAPAGTGAAGAGTSARHAAAGADADLPRQRRPHHHRPHRPRQPRPVHRRPEAGRDRGLRRRRQAGHRVARADSRRPRLQRAGPAAGAGAGRHHPAAQPAHQRHRRARVPAVHRRPAPGLPRDAAHARPAEEDAEEPDSRRRHVRHRDHRHLVDLAAADLRPPGAGLGDLRASPATR